jgi:integrase
MRPSFKLRKEISLNRYPGIYKVLVWDLKENNYTEPKQGYSGYRFRAKKSVKGIKKSKTFITFKEAMNWRNGYVVPVEDTASPFLKDVWACYKEAIFPTIETSSIDTKLYRSGFIEALGNNRMNKITDAEIDALVRSKKELALKSAKNKRSNFDKELEELRVLFNWYRENYEYTYISPILKRHFSMGKIKTIPEKNKKMKPEEFMSFLDSLKQNCNILYYDLAVVQFYTASRIGEMAGLQKESLDFAQKQLEIKHIAVWNRHKKFDYLKDKPKNGKVRYCNINETMKESLLRQINLSKCNYVFQKDGKPLMYRDVQYNYNKALTKCGLFPKYQSTHIMRHSMASITRRVTGSLDSTQAVTGHKDRKMVEHYSGSPDNMQKQAVLDVEKYLNAKVIPFKKSEGPVPQSSAKSVLKNKINAG